MPNCLDIRKIWKRHEIWKVKKEKKGKEKMIYQRQKGIYQYYFCENCKEERPIRYNWEQRYWECLFCHSPIKTPEEVIRDESIPKDKK